jgi:N-acetylmuramoyl-L-alanine amidase
VSQVAANANAWKADLLVSIHFNAGGGDGYEALIYSNARKALGQIFEKYVKAIGQNSRGVKIRTDLGVLRLSNMPAVLNEGAFVDNKKDIQDWDDDLELKKLGIAYAKAAAEFLELEEKATVPAPAPTPVEPEKKYIYRVQVGAYSKKDGAERMLKQLQNAGFGGIIVKSEK